MTSVFTKLVVEHIGPNQWRLSEPLFYHSPDGSVRVTIPRGFECDLASIPRIFWGLLSPAGRYARAAVLHDYLYTIASPRTEETRAAADWEFLVAMKAEGVRWLARNTMFAAVRNFGAPIFYRNR